MATEENNLSSAFPPPPRAFEAFTTENVRKFKEDPSQLPREVLESMRTPDLPTEPYTIYGETWPLEEKLPTLQDANIKQLYKEGCNSVQELEKLVHSLLINFLELITIMSSAPEQFPPKLEHIRIIMLNMHHLINEYRPHQTRESLIHLMERQIVERTAEAEHCERVTEQAQELLTRYQGIVMPTAVTQDITMSSDAASHVVNGQTEQDEGDADLKLFEILSSM